MQGLLTRRRFAQLVAGAAVAPLTVRLDGLFTAAQAAVMPDGPAAPIAPVVPKVFEAFGQQRSDNYDWLRNRNDPRVVDYLHAENAYADAQLGAIKPLIDELAAELKARAATADASVPTFDNGYFYERRFTNGALYPLIVRRNYSAGANEEIVLDVGALAAAALATGNFQYRLGYWTVSPDNTRVAFAVDFTGNLQYRIFVRTIATGDVADQGIGDASSNLVFADDSRTLFYVRNEPTTVRPYQVWRHRVGGEAIHDVLAYEERDPTFSLSLDISKSRKFILLGLEEERTSELRYLPADQPTAEFKIMEPRRVGLQYEADHVGGRFVVRTNLDAPDYRLMIAAEAAPDTAHWSEIVAEVPGHHLAHFEAFEKFIAVDTESESGTAIRLFDYPHMHEIPVPRPVEIGVASTRFDNDHDGNCDASATVLRFRFSGPLQPQCVYDFDLATGASTLRKQDPASRWFEPAHYALDSVSAIAPDGEHVPVTVIYRKDKRKAGGNPTLVVGYGAYGFSFRPTFTPSVFSLLDRGFVYAIAHVRGGHEKGERWYDEGRMLMKRNTFTDFIATTEMLIRRQYADPHKVFAQGASAGGLLMGAVANLRPDLYAGIVAEVPFVDVITTMSDPSVPLTTLEYEEWGNPAVRRQFDYMLSYSPYDNVAPKNYPALFVTAGFYDSQVSYAEPAKWVARLRARKTSASDLIFKTDMSGGHGGHTGRLGSINENAEIMAWLLAHARDGHLP
jgi:oligopeptidase B